MRRKLLVRLPRLLTRIQESGEPLDFFVPAPLRTLEIDHHHTAPLLGSFRSKLVMVRTL